MVEKKRRVLIADDHPPQRAGIRAALEDGGFEVCAEVGDGPAAIEAALRERPDVALLDIHMPGSGIAAAAAITQSAPDIAVVMLTVSQVDEDLFASLHSGAAGYLLKDTDPERLPLALDGVLNGETAIPRVLVSRLVGEFRRRGTRRVPLIGRRSNPLTSREQEVLELMADGLSTREIAGRLFISPVTVRTHISSLLKKLDVTSRAAAVDLLGKGGGPG